MSTSQRLPRLFVGNFEFEHELAAGGRYQPSAAVRRIRDELAAVWGVAAESGDLVWTPESIEEGFAEHLAAAGLPAGRFVDSEADVPTSVLVCPWGWTDELRHLAQKQGWSFLAPPQDVVRAVNSRRFSWQQEQKRNVALPSAAAVHTVGELHTLLQNLPEADARWVLKAEFGMSARERILGQGRRLAENALNWVERRLAADGIVFFEPWVDRVEEAGVQFTIDSAGRVNFCGLTPLLTNWSGVYRGSRFGTEADSLPQWQRAIEVGLEVAAEAASAGYRGPLGIDAVRYRDRDGDLKLRPIQDVNARYTMGRLSLGLRRLLRPGETGSWLHVRWPRDAAPQWLERVKARLPEQVRLIRTSPWTVGGRAIRYGTLALFAPDADALSAAEATVFDAT